MNLKMQWASRTITLAFALAVCCIAPMASASFSVAYADENATVEASESSESPVLNTASLPDSSSSNTCQNDSPESSALSPGWNNVDGDWFYGDDNGFAKTGWLITGASKYWLDPNAGGKRATGLFSDETGRTYYADPSGIVQTNKWMKAEGKWFKLAESGAAQTGWLKQNGKWFYLEPNNGGAMATGWFTVNGNRYYATPGDSGAMKTGWQKIDGAWYYFAPGNSGIMQTGWQKIGGKWFYLDPATGSMKTGWQKIDGGWFYLTPGDSGAMKTGWQKIGGGWYYLTPGNSGRMKTGWQKIGGAWYYLTPGDSGRMKTGWQKIDGGWFYLTPGDSGRMKTGWQKIGGGWFYLTPGDSGRMKTGWQKIGGAWYYLTPGDSGRMKTGWQKIDGKEYYFLPGDSGRMVTGSITISGAVHLFDKSGVWIGQDSVSSQITRWAQSESSATKWLIMVDTKRCKVAVFYGSKGNWKLQRMMDCAPGKSSTPTKKGRFTVGGKGYYFDSGSARCFYYTQFSGNYLFHSVLYYQKPRPTSIMDGRVGIPLSHGCVRLELSNAKWIYDNIPRGTKVHTW